MAQSYTIGRVTADVELKTSASRNPYVRFSLAEHIGYGESARTQYMQVWAWGDDARRLIKGKVKKGSLIWVSGRLELEEFTKQDGATADKRLKVTLDNWGFIPASKPKEAAVQPDDEQGAPVAEIDGDRDTLPE